MRMIVIFHIDDYRVVYYTIIMAVYFTEIIYSLMFRTVDMQPPYEGAKDYFYIADVDDRDYLSLLVRETCKALPDPKPKKKK